jgi:hypothetical protein
MHVALAVFLDHVFVRLGKEIFKISWFQTFLSGLERLHVKRRWTETIIRILLLQYPLSVLGCILAVLDLTKS